MEKIELQRQALDALGMGTIVAALLMGLTMTLIATFPLTARAGSKAQRLWTIGQWLSAVSFPVLLAWISFNPALHALKVLNGPAMFAVTGIVAALVLFGIRTRRKDLYGMIEILVAVGTLMALGDKIPTPDLATLVIGFVGAIYVLVRGLTNISDHMKDQRKA